ncbi:MAG: ACT domain-containing protein [Angelakisella sp.]
MNGVSRITTADDVALITLRNETNNAPLIGKIFSEFSGEGIVIDMISQTVPQGSTMDISFTTDSNQVVKVLTVISRIREQYKQLKIMVSTGNCKIQLYGEEMRQMTGVAAMAIQSLLTAGIEIVMITTSEIDISFIVPPSSFVHAVTVLENAFLVKS